MEDEQLPELNRCRSWEFVSDVLYFYGRMTRFSDAMRCSATVVYKIWASDGMRVACKVCIQVEKRVKGKGMICKNKV